MAETEYTRRDIESVAEKEWGRIDIVEAGGGGSGDLSTCTVTITNESQDASIDFYCPIALKHDDDSEDGASSTVSIVPEGTAVLSVILYKGVAYAYFVDEVTINTTGDIVNNDGDLTITGDGTITLSTGGGK